MLFHITHTTRYVYQTPVSHCLNEVRLRPRSLRNQHVRESTITVNPLPAFMHDRKDYYGNDVTSFEVLEKHDRLEATAETVVQVQAETPGATTSLTWEEARARLAAQADAACVEASEFIFNSPFVPAAPQLAEYASKTFARQRPLLEAVQDLTHRIHADFKYHPKSTSIDLPLTEVLRNRRGVCQDFAHVMIGALRSVRLAARYVSGYVRPGPKVQGAQASHAWVSVFAPEVVGSASTQPTIWLFPMVMSPWPGGATTGMSLRSRASHWEVEVKQWKLPSTSGRFQSAAP
jgi:transglutaminase-like putative cysteine protease